MRGAGKWTSIWKRLVVKESHWNRKSRGGGRVFKDGKDLHMLTGRRDGMDRKYSRRETTEQGP